MRLSNFSQVRITPELGSGLGNFENLPTVSAVYFCLNNEGDVLYIGASKNLYQRWNSHEKYRPLCDKNFVTLQWVEVPSDKLSAIETALIYVFKPPFNIKPGGYYLNRKILKKEPIEEDLDLSSLDLNYYITERQDQTNGA